MRRIAARAPIVAASLLLSAWSAWSTESAAAPPTPSGPHPRLFMGPTLIAAYQAKASTKGSAAAQLVSDCQDSIDNPGDYSTRGGADGNYWPGTAVNCAFAYRATQKPEYLAQAIKYWRTSLDDDQKIGDKLGCVAGVNANWKTWNGTPPAPPVILTVSHDTGYPMRWYGPDIALTYDWLYSAPGVDAALLAQTRTCLAAWSDYYSAKGYHADEVASNYNAGYVIGKTLTAIAIGNDGGADGHLWSDTVDTLFPNLMTAKGLAGANGAIGTAAGPLVGGDWPEGWQYGHLSSLEYAVAARALEEAGVAQPAFDAWTNSLATRYVHGTVPALDGQWVGGDFDSEQVYQGPLVNTLDAVLAGPSSATAASWAAFMKQRQAPKAGTYFYNALAETRAVAPADYRAQSPAPPLWYVARGTRNLYARSAWDEKAYWAVFSSAPQLVSDHQHLAASNWVLSRGADHLIVDPSNYGEPNTFETNAISVDSDGLKDDYAKTQTSWSEAELAYARGTADAVFAARSDFAKAFNFASTASDIPYAHREWVMLPEGEVVTIDRVRTADEAHAMYLGLHVNSGGGGKLTLSGSTASATIGGSKVAIHAVRLSGGTPTITQPPAATCALSCSYPCGSCDAARFPVDKYAVRVPGPFAVAVHVVDALAAGEAQAQVGSLNDDAYDPAPKQNAGVLGAAVFRGAKQTYVVASSGIDGASGATMTYGVPGASAARHVVFDAPADANGQAKVTAVAQGGRCVVTITAGAGFAARPLMFGVSTAASGCAATESTDVAPGQPPPGGGTGPGTVGGDAGPGGAGAAADNGGGSGCYGCVVGSQGRRGAAYAGGLTGALFVFARRRRDGRTSRKAQRRG